MALFDDYEAHDATGLAALVAKGEVSPDDLLDSALARVEARNPRINAVVNLREEVARALIADGLPDGPFRGVPFLLKDLAFEARDFPSHGGSNLSKNTVFSGDCNAYSRMKATGLVTFGRTTSPEGGVGVVTEAAVYGGPTRNPWDLDRTSGGSSGGAGAAVAAGIVPAAHGSDGGGSVRIPAASCGLVGFKPTRARMPEGPYSGEGWAGMATDGFLTRSVRDTAALLDAVMGPDLGMPYFPPPLAESMMAAIAHPPRPLKIAMSTRSLDGSAVHPDCVAAVDATARLLADLGHEVVEDLPTADIHDMMDAWTTIVAVGTGLWIRETVRKRGRPLQDGEVEPIARDAYRLSAEKTGADYLDAVQRIHAYGRALAGFFVGHDMLLTATLAEPPCRIGRLDHNRPDFVAYRMGPGGVFEYSPFTAAFNASGQPAVSLPLHWNADGLPIGVHLAARFGEDDVLMSLCRQLEQARPWADRRPAGFTR
jgi:amidase